MALLVKMTNGDVEHFESAVRSHVSGDHILYLYSAEANAEPLAVFHPDGWWAVVTPPLSPPCAICGQRPTAGRRRCLSGGKHGNHVYIQDDAAA